MISEGSTPNSRELGNECYGFVDADNIKAGLIRLCKKHSFSDEEIEIFDLKRIFQTTELKRYFVYSAVELEKDAPDWIAELRASAGFVFRSGLLTVKSGKRKQEGVDVKLALDAITHAHKRNMSGCVVFSGDGDLLPLVHSLVSEGITTAVCSFDNPDLGDVAGRLRDASDQYWHIGWWILHQCLAEGHRATGLMHTTLEKSKPHETRLEKDNAFYRYDGKSKSFHTFQLVAGTDRVNRWTFQSELAANAFCKLFQHSI